MAGEGYACGESGQRLLSSKIVTPSDALLQVGKDGGSEVKPQCSSNINEFPICDICDIHLAMYSTGFQYYNSALIILGYS